MHVAKSDEEEEKKWRQCVCEMEHQTWEENAKRIIKLKWMNDWISSYAQLNTPLELHLEEKNALHF